MYVNKIFVKNASCTPQYHVHVTLKNINHVPGSFKTGMDSPVINDSSAVDDPSTTSASTGIFPPGTTCVHTCTMYSRKRAIRWRKSRKGVWKMSSLKNEEFLQPWSYLLSALIPQQSFPLWNSNRVHLNLAVCISLCLSLTSLLVSKHLSLQDMPQWLVMTSTCLVLLMSCPEIQHQHEHYYKCNLLTL